MPCDYKKDYPHDWKKISKAAIERAGNKCEMCYAPNGQYVLRGYSKLERLPWYPDDLNYDPKGFKRVKIVLTVHHIDGNKFNNHADNLICLCQKDHLRLDKDKHRKNREATRQRRIDSVMPSVMAYIEEQNCETIIIGHFPVPFCVHELSPEISAEDGVGAFIKHRIEDTVYQGVLVSPLGCKECEKLVIERFHRTAEKHHTIRKEQIKHE